MTNQKYWSVKDILSWTTAKFLSQNIPTPLLDAQILLSHVLKFKTRIELYLNSEKILKVDELDILRSYIKRRLANEPVAYILNQKHWCNLELYVDQNVLIPRPETETLFDFVIETANHVSLKPKIIFDFCTGSGCFAIALGKYFPEARVFAFDISHEALEITKKNALHNNVNNVECIFANVEDEITYIKLQKEFLKADIIVANPPYISLSDWDNLAPEVKNYEPKISLVSEENGLSLGRMIFDGINKFALLNEQSVFAMELAHQQPIKLLAEQSNITTLSARLSYLEKPHNEWFILKDLENRERFLIKINQ